jgi:lantibiotic modifying enzyme
LQSLSKTEPLNAFYTIQSWLRTSTQIDELDPQSRRLHSSFVELWQRIASGGMLELANSLPEDVAAHYQTDRNRWGQYEDIYRDLSDDLITKLSAVGEPVLWEEFNVRQNATPGHHGAHWPDGSAMESPTRSVYCSFLEESRRDGLQSITKKYPVLARHLTRTVEHWLKCGREILTRVHNDFGLLVNSFKVPIDARLAGIESNLSDSHRGGRTVRVLTFTSPSSKSQAIVYKPKDLRMDQAFQRAYRKCRPQTLETTISGASP